MPRQLAPAKRRESGCATTMASTTATAFSTPNQTMELNPANSGTPMSVRKCASQSLSTLSLHMPPKNVIPVIRRRIGRAQMSLPPRLAVPVMERSADTSSRVAGSNSDSGIANTRNAPSARRTRPPAMIGSLRSTSASPTAAPIPTSVKMRATCAPR